MTNKHRILMEHKQLIVDSYHQGVPVSRIARREDVSMVTIYKYLLQWTVREKREKVTSEGYRRRRKSTLILPFEKRVSPELLAKMKENTRVNKKYASRYILNEDYYSTGRF
jgi:transposase